MATPKVFLTRGMLARKFAVAPRTVTRWESNPEVGLPKATVVNGRSYYDEAAIDEWAASRAARNKTKTTAA